MKSNNEQKVKKGFLKYFMIRSNNDAGSVDEEAYDDEDNGEKSVDFSSLIRILLVFLVVGGGAFILHYLTQRNFNGYEVVEKTNVKNSSMLDYIAYQNSLLKYSKDGATYVDEKGGAVLNETFAMKMPSADVSGKYVAIADLNGNDVYVFDDKGKVSNTSMPYNICDISVASQGEFAVIWEGDKVN